MPLLASIDVGSNTVRLLVAEVRGGRIVREALNLRYTTRLSEGLTEGGTLKPEARERTLKALKDYSARLRESKVKGVSAIATAALRKAADSGDFINEVEEETGLELEVISGEEEARRTLLGIKAGVGDLVGPGEKLLIDIGGGSTELVSTSGWKRFRALSLPLGAVSLYERFLLNDPPTVSELVELESHCFKAMRVLKEFRPEGGWTAVIGTAGTITTLAAVEMAMDVYDPVKVTGHIMGRDTVARLFLRFAGLSEENRKLLAGLEPGREDIILSGTALLGVIMDVAGAGSIMVCDYGLREGNLLNFYKNKGFR